MNTGDEMVRGLGDVLLSHEPMGFSCTCGWRAETATYASEHIAHVAHILAAHVLGLVAAGKAEALREAAKELPGFDGIRTHGDAARWLRDRADDLAEEAS